MTEEMLMVDSIRETVVKAGIDILCHCGACEADDFFICRPIGLADILQTIQKHINKGLISPGLKSLTEQQGVLTLLEMWDMTIVPYDKQSKYVIARIDSILS